MAEPEPKPFKSNFKSVIGMMGSDFVTANNSDLIRDTSCGASNYYSDRSEFCESDFGLHGRQQQPGVNTLPTPLEHLLLT